MSVPLVIHARAGRLLPRCLGVRLTAESEAIALDDPLDSGARRVGPLELQLETRKRGALATIDWSVRNVSSEPVALESVFVGLCWPRAGQASGPGNGLRFLRNGWQSWSFTGMRDLDSAGQEPFPSGEWLRGLHHARGPLPPDRAGWHESAIVTVAGGAPSGPACLAGVLENGENFGCVYLRPSPAREAPGPASGSNASVDIAVELWLEVTLEPGEHRSLEPVYLALGDQPDPLLEDFAERWGQRAGARQSAGFQAGWCSWYHFFHDVSEDDLLRNLDALVAARGDIPIDVVQLDDGYQRAIGDWLVTNEKFPRGLEPVARDIRSAGFQPGIWTAPFCAVGESQLFSEHPDFFLRADDQPFRSFAHSMWSKSGWVYALDTTRQEVIDHVRQLFSSLAVMGFDYLKLDFLFCVAMQADAGDPSVTRAGRLRRGLDAIRAGAGDDAFLLGCGSPLGPAVGVVDGMRIGPDVAPSWEPNDPMVIPGLGPAVPSTRSAVRSIVHRAWMHRRLWLNDPDCLMARSSHTGLTAGERRTLAATIAVTGGMVVFSDDMPVLDPGDRQRVAEVIALSREVDALGQRGQARAHGWLEPGGIRAMVAQGIDHAMVALVNTGDDGAHHQLSLAEERLGPSQPEPLLGSAAAIAGAVPGSLGAVLDAHDSALYRLPGACPLAVFCDFDGTFSITDVGLTLARTYSADRIPAAKEGLVSGQLDAWHFTRALLDDLALPKEELERFLSGVELDPGAVDLLAWCRERGVPFRILSDGFDWVLEWLRDHHGVDFEHDANHLRYEGDRWKIAPGHPDPACVCGTGTCKRGRIAAWRAEHPGAFCVHIGNGRISDLCGALEADLVFAKDSLAGALDKHGRAYHRFATLSDVIAVLDALSQPG